MATLKNTTIDDTGFLRAPVGTTAQRPSPVAGHIRHNSTTSMLEIYDGSSWGDVLPAKAGGSMLQFRQSVESSITLPTNRNTLSAGPVTVPNGVTVTIPSGAVWTVV
jgi:hypothetical protein